MPGSTIGTEVGARFDPMLAKIVAHGRDRADAFDRLTAALDETVVLGRRHEPAVPPLARPPAGRARRRGADRHAGPDLAARRLGRARRDPRRRLAGGRDRRCDPAPRAIRGRGGWRLNGPATVRLEIGGAAIRTIVATAAACDPLETGPVVARRRPRRRRGPQRARSASPRRRTSIGPRAPRRARRPRRPADVVAPMPGAVLDGPRRGRRGRGGRRPDRDPRGDEDGARRRRADRRAPSRSSASRPADQVVRGQALATIEP